MWLSCAVIFEDQEIYGNAMTSPGSLTKIKETRLEGPVGLICRVSERVVLCADLIFNPETIT